METTYEIEYSDEEMCESLMDELRGLSDEEWEMLDSMKSN